MTAPGSGRAVFIVLLVVVLLAIAGIAILVLLGPGAPPVRIGDTVLELDLSRAYAEHLPEDPLAVALFGREPTLRDVLRGLDRARDDDRVVAVLARVGASPAGLATLQELREAVLSFRESGKKAIAFGDTLGEFGPGNGAYYLASAFDEIHLQPSGDIGLTGVRVEVPFLRGALEKLGIEARMDHRHEYKNAMNQFTESALTEAHEEALQAIADSLLEQLVEGIAAGRGLDEERVRGLFDRGPFLGAEALEEDLVDRLHYRDEVYDAVRGEFGERVGFTSLEDYLSARRIGGGGRTVALIYGVGTVVRGPSGYDPLSGSVSMGADTVAGAFRDAVDDDDVEAILFRVDSPGGSYVASDTIWRETIRAREAGKPVIVSMGDLAGSGGYFVAMAADAIVAQPGTITGSIGVYAGKLVTRDGWQKLGISWGEVSAGERAAIWSSIRDYDDGGWERLQASLDRIYEDFTAKVAEGRAMEPERVSEVARGRIWTGADALGLGLVDELGGYRAALGRVREAIGAGADERVRLKLYPRPRSPFELLLERGRRRGLAGDRLDGLLAAARTVIEAARRLGLLESERGVLSMPALPSVE